MEIVVNGSKINMAQNITILELIKNLNYSDKKIAVELNSEIISRSSYTNKIIVDGDKIEIITAIGGG